MRARGARESLRRGDDEEPVVTRTAHEPLEPLGQLSRVFVREPRRQSVEIVDHDDGAAGRRRLDELGDRIPRRLGIRRHDEDAGRLRRERAQCGRLARTCSAHDEEPAILDPHGDRHLPLALRLVGETQHQVSWSDALARELGEFDPPRKIGEPRPARAVIVGTQDDPLDVGRSRKRDPQATRARNPPPCARARRRDPPHRRQGRAASSVPMTARLSAASATRRLTRRGQFARSASRTTPATRCVPSTRCMPRARPRAAMSMKTACSSG